MNDILSMQKVDKVFTKKTGRPVKALSRVNLTVRQGDFVAVKGPSGSGKTTLLNVLGLLDKPSTGKVVVDGIDVSRMNERELCDVRAGKIGFVFQSFNLLPILNAVENVELPMELFESSAEVRRKRAKNLLKLVGLKKRIYHKPGELSAGEKQRVAIARAMANRPAIILADEPTGNLDSRTSRQIMQLMSKLNDEKGTTIIVVTHDPAVARMARRIIKMRDGKISTISECGGADDEVRKVANKLDLLHNDVKKLFSVGFDDTDKILDLTETALEENGKFKNREIKRIMNRVNRYIRRKS